MFFFAGMAIVHLRCPDVNRPSRNFESFQKEGRTLQYVLQELRDTYLSHAGSHPAKANHFLRAMLNHSEFVENHEEVSQLLKANTDRTPYTRAELWRIVDVAKLRPEASVTGIPPA
jgi:hypothetical protein